MSGEPADWFPLFSQHFHPNLDPANVFTAFSPKSRSGSIFTKIQIRPRPSLASNNNSQLSLSLFIFLATLHQRGCDKLICAHTKKQATLVIEMLTLRCINWPRWISFQSRPAFDLASNPNRDNERKLEKRLAPEFGKLEASLSAHMKDIFCH